MKWLKLIKLVKSLLGVNRGEKYRIVIATSMSKFTGQQRKYYAVQKRAGIQWVVVARCDSLAQCRFWIGSNYNSGETILKVIS